MKKQTVGVLLFLPLLLFTFSTTGCSQKAAPSSSAQVVDATGESLSLRHYRRIVSLAPEMTENLLLLGLKERLVGKTQHCPKEVSAKIIGTLLQPNVEAIARLQPDLVLATKEGNLPQGVLQLRRLGIPVFVGPPKGNFQDIRLQFFLLARLLGVEEKGRELLQKWEAELESYRQQGENRNKHLSVLLVIWSKPLIVAGPASFHDHMIRLAGGENLCPERGRYPRLSVEGAARLRPEVLLLMGNTPLPPGLSAPKIHRLPSHLSVPTPSRFVEGVKHIAQALYGESRQ